MDTGEGSLTVPQVHALRTCVDAGHLRVSNHNGETTIASATADRLVELGFVFLVPHAGHRWDVRPTATGRALTEQLRRVH